MTFNVRKLSRQLLASVFLTTSLFTQTASAQENSETPRSLCQAIAENEWQRGWPGEVPVIKANLQLANTLSPHDVSITYVGHSTFRIEDAKGLTIATDYAGFAGAGVVPDVVTMNHAHVTHYTIAPDPAIPHVLKGWGSEGKPARHFLQVGDAVIRNVTTNIDNHWVGFERDGNSIFIFEMAGLCIGHLGHLHHLPTDNHYAQIGRLDILMVPVDGGYTMNVEDMSKVVSRLNSSLILPMHWFGSFSLNNFTTMIADKFPVEFKSESRIVVSLNTLPQSPRIVVLQPESVSFGNPDD
ncbi:MAG: MBL fold metallo-hydrolase [Pseudomonadota bacterium]